MQTIKKEYEFIGDIYNDYYEEIDIYIDKMLAKDKVQDEEGDYLEHNKEKGINPNFIDNGDEALDFYGYQWLDEQIAKKRVKELDDSIYIFI